MKAILVHLITMILLITGCNTDERLVQISREAADRQAEQNKEMARVNQSVAEGTKSLITEHSQARQELTGLQDGIQTQQVEVNRQRDDLESERREIAGQRLTESRLGPVLRSLGVFAVCALTLGFCYALVTKMYSPADDAVGELLLEDLVSEQPKLLPSQVSRPRLETHGKHD